MSKEGGLILRKDAITPETQFDPGQAGADSDHRESGTVIAALGFAVELGVETKANTPRDIQGEGCDPSVARFDRVGRGGVEFYKACPYRFNCTGGIVVEPTLCSRRGARGGIVKNYGPGEHGFRNEGEQDQAPKVHFLSG